MGEYRISISDLAKQDIREIAAYIRYDLQEPIIAEKTIKTVLDAIFTLEEMPARIGLVNDEHLANKQVRGQRVNNYTAFFRINETLKTVEIIRVIYSRRDWPTLLL
jgi:plasmid stabilization system protein ParE